MDDKQLTDLIVKVTRTDAATQQMKALLLGNGQPGKIKEMEGDIRGLHRFKWLLLGACMATGSGVAATLLGWVK